MNFKDLSSHALAQQLSTLAAAYREVPAVSTEERTALNYAADLIQEVTRRLETNYNRRMGA